MKPLRSTFDARFAAGAIALACAYAAVAAGCESPVQDEEIAAQGDEVAGVPEGPFHRYGQNCLACHGGYGPGPQFLLAGTVFATPDADIPVLGATVTVTDSAGTTIPVVSNCAGNFYIDIEGWEAEFPLRVEVACPMPDGSIRRNVMGTRINRDGGCASCHERGVATADSPGQIFCAKTQPDPPFEIPASCEGGPLAGSQ